MRKSEVSVYTGLRSSCVGNLIPSAAVEVGRAFGMRQAEPLGTDLMLLYKGLAGVGLPSSALCHVGTQHLFPLLPSCHVGPEAARKPTADAAAAFSLVSPASTAREHILCSLKLT